MHSASKYYINKISLANVCSITIRENNFFVISWRQMFLDSRLTLPCVNKLEARKIFVCSKQTQISR